MFNINRIWNSLHALAVGVLSLVLLGLAWAPKAAADIGDKKTFITFSGPVEIPGKVLPAGTYVFKLLDSVSDRNIVQIFNNDETRLYATILAIPNYRLKPSSETTIRFEERPSGTPEALKAWFYPGDQYGQEFVYPHKRAAELAKQNKQNVLSMSDRMTKNITAAAKSASAPSVQALEKTEVTAVNPSGQQVGIEQSVSTKPQENK